MAFYRCIGGGSGVSPTDITPSNSSPVALTANDPVNPLAAGYAIESYLDITPSDASPVSMTSGGIYKTSANGVAIESSPIGFTPSNISPKTLTSGKIYKVEGSGVAFASKGSITPSNSDPVILFGKTPYYIDSGTSSSIKGFAIADYLSKTPSNSNPPSVSSGDIVKMGGSGYLYETQQGSISGYAQAAKDTASAATSKTISNKNGKTLLLFVFQYAQSANLTYTNYDSISVSGGTKTKITTLLDADARVAGTFFKLSVTSNTCTISHTGNMRIIAFEGEIS